MNKKVTTMLFHNSWHIAGAAGPLLYCRVQGPEEKGGNPFAVAGSVSLAGAQSTEEIGRRHISNKAVTWLESLKRHCPKAASDILSRHHKVLHSVP